MNSQFLICLFGLNVLLKVPPPRKFPGPPGGAGSVVIRMQPKEKNQVHFADSASPVPSSISTHQPPASSKPLPVTVPVSNPRQRGKAFRKGHQPIFGEGTEESRSNKRPASQNIFPQSTLRGFTTLRAAQLVRLHLLFEKISHLILL